MDDDYLMLMIGVLTLLNNEMYDMVNETSYSGLGLLMEQLIN